MCLWKTTSGNCSATFFDLHRSWNTVLYVDVGYEFQQALVDMTEQLVVVLSKLSLESETVRFPQLHP